MLEGIVSPTPCDPSPFPCACPLRGPGATGNKLFQGTFIKILYGNEVTLFMTLKWTLLNSVVALVGYYVAAFTIDKQWMGRWRMQGTHGGLRCTLPDAWSVVDGLHGAQASDHFVHPRVPTTSMPARDHRAVQSWGLS
jgi:hypothetical protein